jgi:hypothetical protein
MLATNKLGATMIVIMKTLMLFSIAAHAEAPMAASVPSTKVN